MSEHYVHHLLSSGDTVRTRFECRAPEDGRCRSICTKCGNFAHGCQCRPFAEPELSIGEPCGILPFLEEDPEECYDGAEQPVRGPAPQPITTTWEGDYYVWDYEQEGERHSSTKEDPE